MKAASVVRQRQCRYQRDLLLTAPVGARHLMKWWLSRNKYRQHRTLRVGGANEVIQETWCAMVPRLQSIDELPCAPSTYVVNSVKWCLAKMWQRVLSEPNRVARIPDLPAEPEPDMVELSELKSAVDRMLKTLTYREREIVRLRFGLGDSYSYSLVEVGRIFKITRERVRQIESKVLRKLQHHSRKAIVVACLDRLEDGRIAQ